jgi:4'-phosphopantetheinyl transferase
MAIPKTNGDTGQSSRAAIALGDSDVHIWRAELDLPPASIENISDLLAEDELRRANGFFYERDRKRFVASRGLLRLILSRYSGIEPGAIQFTYSEYGKPYIDYPSGASSLSFNLTHSGNLALFVVAWRRQIGVDLELIRSGLDIQGIINRFFAPAEIDAYMTIPADERPRAFFQCWTRKEAYLKAKGVGLASPLNEFSVSLIPGEPARLTQSLDPAELHRWALHDLNLGTEYVATIALEKHDWKLTCFHWKNQSLQGTRSLFEAYTHTSKSQ